MKKSVSVLLLNVCVIGIAVVLGTWIPSAAAPALAAAPSPAQPIVLKLSHSVPPGSPQHKGVFAPWAEELEKRTNGKVKVKLFTSEQLGKASEAYDMALRRTVDISWVVPSFVIGQFPLDEIFHLPFLIPGGTDDPLGSRIRRTLYEKYLTPINFKEVKVLWTGRTGANVIMSSKPIRTMADAKGMVLGYPGGRILMKLLQAVGASPVQVSAPDMYTNLEKRVTDGQVIPLEAMMTFKLNEVVKYVSMLNAGGGSFLTVMNRKSWDSLPPDIQKIIDEMSPWAEEIQARAWAGTRAFTVSIAKKSNIELIEFLPEERNRWVEVSKPIEEEWAREIDTKGLPATKMIQEIKQILNK
jgi:TRAP-type C4-dicarboxylate transport system substrate-binding protein